MRNLLPIILFVVLIITGTGSVFASEQAISTSTKERIMKTLRLIQKLDDSSLVGSVLPKSLKKDIDDALNYIDHRSQVNTLPAPLKVNSKDCSDNDLPSIRCINGILLPINTDEVQQIILSAKKKHFKVRAIGSHHSSDGAIYDSDKHQQILMHLSGDLRKVQSITPARDNRYAIVRTGAGINLGVDPIDPESNKQNSFNNIMDEAGYALPILGGISHQTIAGFMSTSSSGGSSQFGVSDVLESIEWVDGNGIIHVANKGDELFNAVGVSMGLFGIITHVTLKMPAHYLVAGEESNAEIEDSIIANNETHNYPALQEAFYSGKYDYVRMNWLPQDKVHRVMLWHGNQVQDVGQQRTPYRHTLGDKTVSFLTSIVLKIINHIDVYTPHVKFLQSLKASLLKLFSDPKDKKQYLDVWYKALPIDNQVDVHGLMQFAFSEMWFPNEESAKVLNTLKKIYKENPQAASNFIVEVYPGKKSDFWLSPSYGQDAIRIDFYWHVKNLGDRDAYFSIFWQKLIHIKNARYHWGKVIPIPGKSYEGITYKREQVVGSYRKLNDWLTIREQMDPDQLFVTDYWRSILGITHS